MSLVFFILTVFPLVVYAQTDSPAYRIVHKEGASCWNDCCPTSMMDDFCSSGQEAGVRSFCRRFDWDQAKLGGLLAHKCTYIGPRADCWHKNPADRQCSEKRGIAGRRDLCVLNGCAHEGGGLFFPNTFKACCRRSDDINGWDHYNIAAGYEVVDGKAIASDWYDGHGPQLINNGKYGDANAYITSNKIMEHSIAFRFKLPTNLESFALGRDDTGTYKDRLGMVSIYYSLVPGQGLCETNVLVGEGISNVADRVGSSVDRLLILNGLTGPAPHLVAGQRLIRDCVGTGTDWQLVDQVGITPYRATYFFGESKSNIRVLNGVYAILLNVPQGGAIDEFEMYKERHTRWFTEEADLCEDDGMDTTGNFYQNGRKGCRGSYTFAP